MVLRGVGDIVLAVVRRRIILASIDTEDREVPRMTWPHPVVRITTELTYRSWRGEDETHIAEHVIGDEIVLVVRIVWAYLNALVFALQTLTFSDLQSLADLLYLRKTIDLVLRFLELSQDLLCYISYRREVAHGKPFDRELFGEALRNKAITEVVMINGTLRLDGIEATVMVREDKPLTGNGHPSTSTTEDDDRVGDAGFVQTIQGINGKAEAQFLHLGKVLSRELIEQPHPLIGLRL